MKVVKAIASLMVLASTTSGAYAQNSYVDRSRGALVRWYMGDVNRQAQYGANYRSAFVPGPTTGYSVWRNGAAGLRGYGAATAFKLQGRALIDVGRAGDAYQYLVRRGGIGWGRRY